VAKSNSDSIEEFDDMFEIIHALPAQHGSSFKELEQARQEKAEKRGDFLEKVFLIEVKD
jgi:predicted house-cleaning noncanonical NTP pyrophosphatase (MazG superfamily)